MLVSCFYGFYLYKKKIKLLQVKEIINKAHTRSSYNSISSRNAQLNFVLNN